MKQKKTPKSFYSQIEKKPIVGNFFKLYVFKILQ